MSMSMRWKEDVSQERHGDETKRRDGRDDAVQQGRTGKCDVSTRLTRHVAWRSRGYISFRSTRDHPFEQAGQPLLV